MQRVLGLCRGSCAAFRKSRTCFSLSQSPILRPNHINFQIQKAHTLAPNISRENLPMSLVTEKHGNFDLVKRLKLNYTDVVVSKWRSRNTGLSIVHVDYEGEAHS